MGIIVRRGKKFYLQYKDVDGTRRMKAAKGAASTEEAKRQLNAIEKRIFDGNIGVPEAKKPDPEVERRKTITVAEIGEQFTEKFTAPRIKNPADYRMEAKSVLKRRIYPTLGTRAAADVTMRDVEELQDTLATTGEYKPQSVNNTLNSLSKLYGWAKKQGLIDCENPVRGVERYRSEESEPITSEKFLSIAEATAMLAATLDLQRPGVASLAAMMLYPMAATALYSGLRKGELYGLRWPAIDFDRGQIEVSRSYDGKTKSGKTRHVPLHPDLAVILRVWRDRPNRSDGGLIFPVEGRMGRSEETLGFGALLQATIGREPPKVWHSLRHSFAAHLVMSGGSILSLQKLLGHADITTTMIYAHLSPDHLAGEVARLNFAPPAPAGVANLSEERRKRILEAFQSLLEKDPAAALAAITNQDGRERHHG